MHETFTKILVNMSSTQWSYVLDLVRRANRNASNLLYAISTSMTVLTEPFLVITYYPNNLLLELGYMIYLLHLSTLLCLIMNLSWMCGNSLMA